MSGSCPSGSCCPGNPSAMFRLSAGGVSSRRLPGRLTFRGVAAYLPGRGEGLPGRTTRHAVPVVAPKGRPRRMESEVVESAVKATRLLVVEDDPALSDTVVTGLERKGYVVSTARDGEAALRTLAREEFDVVLMDLRMPRKDGIQVLQAMRAEGYDAEVIIVTGYAEVETAIEALKLRAFDYVTKPFRLRELLTRAGYSRSHVLIQGESGSGKELAARYVHRTSDRRDQPFLAINCAALLDELLESELFGHEKGAFTGAAGQRQGL